MAKQTNNNLVKARAVRLVEVLHRKEHDMFAFEDELMVHLRSLKNKTFICTLGQFLREEFKREELLHMIDKCIFKRVEEVKRAYS